jgi:hypothetical protein
MMRSPRLRVSALLLFAALLLTILVVGSTGGAATTRAEKTRAAGQALAASAKGPAGPRGPRGPRGPAGPPGPAGPSDASEVGSGGQLHFVKGGGETDPVSVDVDRGTYVIIAKGSVQAANTTGGSVSCNLATGTGSHIDGSVLTLFPKNVGVVTLAGVNTFGEAGTVSMTCATPDSVSQMLLYDVSVIAIHVGKKA